MIDINSVGYEKKIEGCSRVLRKVRGSYWFSGPTKPTTRGHEPTGSTRAQEIHVIYYIPFDPSLKKYTYQHLLRRAAARFAYNAELSGTSFSASL